MSFVSSLSLTSLTRVGLFFATLVLMTGKPTFLQADVYCESSAAVGNLVQNCGFEAVDGGGQLTNWAVSGGIASRVSSVSPGPPTLDGSPFKGELNDGASSVATTLTQTSISLLAGVTYNISFDYYITANTFKFSILNGVTSLFSTGNLNNPGDNTFVRYTNTFTSLSNQVVSIVFETLQSQKPILYLDNVIVQPQSIPVPEPATMILLGSLCSAVVGYKYKRKQSSVG